MGQVPQEVQDEVKKFKVALHKFLLTMGDVPVFFERNYKTSHLQVQCVPVPKSLKTHLAEEFEVSYLMKIIFIFVRFLIIESFILGTRDCERN